MNYKVKIGIFISILLVTIVVLLGWYQHTHQEDNLIKEKKVNLSSTDLKTYESRQANLESMLKNATNDDDKYNIYLSIGQNEYALGHLQDSKDALESAIAIKPNEPAAYENLFNTQVDMKDNVGAERSIKKAIDLRPDSTEYWRRYIQFEQGVMHRNSNDLNQLYLDALKKTDNSVDIITVYAQYLESIGDLASARQYWQKAIIANPTGKSTYQKEIDRINKTLSGR